LGSHRQALLRAQRLSGVALSTRGRSFSRETTPRVSERVIDFARQIGSAHAFSGVLVDGKQGAAWLLDSMANASSSVSLCSAYIRSEALAQLLASSRMGQGRILVRWQMSDLRSGASDLDAYTLAKGAGLEFAVRLDFHGKVFSVPGRGLLVGSANATLSGLGLRGGANEEVCTVVPDLPENLALIDGLFAGAVTLNDELVGTIRQALLDAPEGATEASAWPPLLMRLLTPQRIVDRLLADECLWSAPRIMDGLLHDVDGHDQGLLGLTPSPTAIASARHCFQASSVYKWLVQRLEKSGGESYFGSLSEALQNSLLDNPGVHRREAKTLLQNLVTWCELMPDCGVLVDRPRYSQRIRLV
jgi:hypothetical protein